MLTSRRASRYSISAKLFFFPDVILYFERGTFGGISYSDVHVEQHLTRFIEVGQVPGDARIIDTTWRYVNKNGGPDRRFNNNAQLPVAQYGVLELTSSRGLNIHLNTSNADASPAFVNCWRVLRTKLGIPNGAQSPDPSQRRTNRKRSRQRRTQYRDGQKTCNQCAKNIGVLQLPNWVLWLLSSFVPLARPSEARRPPPADRRSSLGTTQRSGMFAIVDDPNGTIALPLGVTSISPSNWRRERPSAE